MSVTMKDLSVGCYANGMTLWLYHTKHSRRELEHNSYWADMFSPNAAEGYIRPGDFIMVRHDSNNDHWLGNTIYVMTSTGLVLQMSSTFKSDRY